MCITERKKKIFGVALDPADDPWSLQLKRQWMKADPASLDWLSACLDPYDAVTGKLSRTLEEHLLEPTGKFPVPSWLWPKPKPADLPLVNAQNMGKFFDSNRPVEIVEDLQSFVRERIFPDIPVMLGVDHSATAGVVSALAERHGPEKLSAIVLDRHFDAIPLSIRLEGAPREIPDDGSGMPAGFGDRFCCGNFWGYLMDSGTVLPRNLLFIGVSDYPEGDENPQGRRYRKAYLDFEERGCAFFRRTWFEGQYNEKLIRFLRDNIHTPYVYISLDLDVGSYASTFAARYMDGPGISEKNILDVAHILSKECRGGKFEIAGLDIMEFNMHFLGIETTGGIKDNTLALVEKFIAVLT